MARGYIYEASSNPDNLGYMSKADFCEDIDALKADYVDTRKGENALKLASSLCNSFVTHGATVIPHNIKEDAEDEDDDADEETDEQDADDAVPYFEVYFPARFRDSYFKHRFELVQQTIADMTLHEFATDADFKVYNLRNLIHDTYDDVVCYDGYRYTLDGFVRNHEDFRFYVSAKTVVLMH